MLQQILKLISFYTATDPETSVSFASRWSTTVCCIQASPDFYQALLQFIHIIHRFPYSLSSLHTANTNTLLNIAINASAYLLLFWLKIKVVSIADILCCTSCSWRSAIGPIPFLIRLTVFINRFKNYTVLFLVKSCKNFLHLFCGKFPNTATLPGLCNF